MQKILLASIPLDHFQQQACSGTTNSLKRPLLTAFYGQAVEADWTTDDAYYPANDPADAIRLYRNYFSEQFLDRILVELPPFRKF